MAKIQIKPEIKYELHFTVSEEEACALDALAGYGDGAFIETFYEKIGRAYLEPHEKGLRAFLISVREGAPEFLLRVNSARKAINEQ